MIYIHCYKEFIMEQFTKEELKLLLEIACNEAQRYSDKKLTPPKEIYGIRYKIRDLLNSL